MGNRWIRTLVAAGLCAAAATLGQGQPAVAVPEDGGQAALQLQSVSVPVQAGDSFALFCGFADFPRDAYVMVTDEFAPTGGEAFRGVTRLSGADGEVRATGKVSKFEFEQYPTEDDGRTPGIFGSPGIASIDGVITKSWALWTAPGQCQFTVNGVQQPIVDHDPQGARILSLAEFGNGASAQIDPLVAGGLLLNHDQHHDGRLTSILDVSSANGSSALLEVVGPEGQRYEALTFNPFLWIDEAETSGEWSYTVSGVQSTPHFPALWIMELPVEPPVAVAEPLPPITG